MTATVITPDLRLKIVDRVKTIVKENHTDNLKQQLQNENHHERLTFACPYCGDSSGTDFNSRRKKRGNLYWENLFYHCFNCFRHVSLTQFFKDFNEKIDTDDLFTIIDYIKENKSDFKKRETLDYDLFVDLKTLGVDKEKVFTSLNIRHITPNTFQAYPYLKSRNLHYKLDYFGWNSYSKRLFIFNYNHDGSKILGYQVKPIGKYGSKYQTYNIQKLRESLGLEFKYHDKVKIEKIKKLSTLFGILRTDLTRDFNVFEGPLDSLFMENSIALAGIDKETFNFGELPTCRYFFDNDKVGKEFALQKIRKNKKVFLWTKFIRDNKFEKYKIKDLNDLINLVFNKLKDKESFKKIKRLSDYFSDNPLDAIWI
jgi:hypothetical protein